MKSVYFQIMTIETFPIFMMQIIHMDVSKNNGTPKSSILIGFSMKSTIHFGVPVCLETPIYPWQYDHNFNPLSLAFRWRLLLVSGRVHP